MMNRANDLICLSHLRWNFVFQRPNHLMAQCARERRVFFVEEPLLEADPAAPGPTGPELIVREVAPQLGIVTPRGSNSRDPAVQAELLAQLCRKHGIHEPMLWFYTPMALDVARDLRAALVVYDCMDELSAFRGASPLLQGLERELLARADLVFTGGRSLFEAKRGLHSSVHLFPSSVDSSHFRAARSPLPEPADQRGIGRPRLGFFGVIDERLDLDLLANLARQRPDWSIVVVGPVVKIDPRSLPCLPNIHYLGQKSYEQLPAYLAGWDVALMPFALNEATRFISPTKTLEYLAGGKPVVSTEIRDVVSPYAELGLVQISDARGFVGAVERALSGAGVPDLATVDQFIARTSWESTWADMSALIERGLEAKRSRVA
jgi:glycosyltransferase involved in cell wall biosynthesis